MSMIECSLSIDQWVKERMEQLQRINSRIDSNIEKYRKRKTLASLDDRDSAEGRSSQGSGNGEGGRGSLEEQGDDIADDWRKLMDTITGEIPVYLRRNTKSKDVNKITTVEQQAKRIARKIEAHIESSDLRDYRHKQSQKKWENQTKVSLIRKPRSAPEREDQYEEIKEEEEAKQSVILDDLNLIGRDKMKQLDREVEGNEKWVTQYESKKEVERQCSRLLLGLILFISLFILFSPPIHTRLHIFYFDLFEP